MDNVGCMEMCDQMSCKNLSPSYLLVPANPKPKETHSDIYGTQLTHCGKLDKSLSTVTST